MRRALRAGSLVAGLALLGAAVLDLVTLRQHAGHIRAEGATVSAGVVRASSRRHQLLKVEYSFGGRTYRADLVDIGWAASPARGARITLAVDPDRPREVAGPGLVSAAPWRYPYAEVGLVGLVLLVHAAWTFRRGPAPGSAVGSRSLVHPAAAWADRADSTVLALILMPGDGGPPWDEELPARRVDAATSEICCVPYLQTRLALGDVVRVDARGYAGAVTRPSGRVTFAVLTADPAAGAPDVRTLTSEFPGTVVEEVGAGRFAVAAASEAEADHLHARIRAWERDGRVAYRSVLHTDPSAAPLI